MKNYKLKNTIAGIMLTLGIVFQILSPAVSENQQNMMQTCNKQLLNKLEQQVLTVRYIFGFNQKPTEYNFKKGE
jgi:hypothetical protein